MDLMKKEKTEIKNLEEKTEYIGEGDSLRMFIRGNPFEKSENGGQVYEAYV